MFDRLRRDVALRRPQCLVKEMTAAECLVDFTNMLEEMGDGDLRAGERAWGALVARYTDLTPESAIAASRELLAIWANQTNQTADEGQ